MLSGKWSGQWSSTTRRKRHPRHTDLVGLRFPAMALIRDGPSDDHSPLHHKIPSKPNAITLSIFCKIDILNKMSPYTLGIIASVVALISWGIGDFLIQKSVRRLGDWEPLFIISLFGAIILSPFVWHDLGPILISSSFFLLLAIGATFLFASLFQFEGYKRGKLAVVEPIEILEIPIAGTLAFFFLQEKPETLTILLVFILLCGLVLVSLKPHHLSKKSWLEKGVAFALAASFFMGITNFLVAYSSRLTNPLLVVWFFDIFIASVAFVYLVLNKRLKPFFNDLRANPTLITAVCILDNTAWACFAFACSVIPLIIALALSESYIALACVLGIFFNRESLTRYQFLGLIIAIPSAIAIAILA